MENKTLYIGCNGMVAAIDVRTGEMIWEKKLSSKILSSLNHADVSIIHDDKIVYAGCYGHLFALDAKTGEELWHNELKGWGHNEVSLALQDKSVQFITRKEVQHNTVH